MAMYFGDQYVQLNGADVAVPPHVVKASKNLNSYVENGILYVNGYRYFPATHTWKKTWYAKWVQIDMYTQVQMISSVMFLLFVLAIVGICSIIK